MTKKNYPKPEPVPVNTVCSLCGEAWSLHVETGGEVLPTECIRLLKAKVSPFRIWSQQPQWTPAVSPWLITTGGASTSQTSYTTPTPRAIN